MTEPRTPQAAATAVPFAGRAKRYLLASLCTCLLTGPVLAQAAEPRAQLQYQREPGAEACEDEESLRNSVIGRLGFNPFDPAAARVVRVAVRGAGEGLLAKVELLGSSGTVLGGREIPSSSRDCRELGASVELAVALAVDPVGASRPREPAAPPSVAAPPVAAPSSPSSPSSPTAPPPPSLASPALSASLAALAAVNALPSPTGGLALGLGARWGDFELDLEGATLLPRRADVAGGWLNASSLGMTLAPCLHQGPAIGCLAASAGMLRISGDGLSNPDRAQAGYVQLGARLGAQLRASANLSARATFFLDVPLSHTTVLVGRQPVWTTPAVALGLGVSVAWELQTDSGRQGQ